MSRRRETYHPVKIGSMPRTVVWATMPAGGFEVGRTIEWRECKRACPQEARIWQIGPPPEYMLYLEL